MTLLDFGGAVTIAAITSGITVWLSRRQSFSEKWWERKAAAYSEIITALSHIEYDAWLVAVEHHAVAAESPSASKSEREAHARAARAHIERVTAIGAFIISDEVAHHLSMFRQECVVAEEESRTMGELVLASHDAVKKAIAAIRQSAGRELKKGWSGWPI